LEGEFPDSDKVLRHTKEKINAQEIMYGDVTYNIIFKEDDNSEENGDTLDDNVQNNTDVALLLFSIIDLRSFQNVKLKWNERVRENNQDLPIIFVGNKVDLRDEAASIHILLLLLLMKSKRLYLKRKQMVIVKFLQNKSWV